MLIPYAHHTIEPQDIAAVEAVLHSSWLTTGPTVERFEKAVAEYVGAKYAISFSSGTAALHGAYKVAIPKSSEPWPVPMPALTFAATANAAILAGGKPFFVDIGEQALCVDSMTLFVAGIRAWPIVTMDYGGHPCDYDTIEEVEIADACHALGATYKGRKVGTLADMTCFSFHPAKHITTGEGGMVTTNRDDLAEQLRRFRNHGIDKDLHNRGGSHEYDVVDTGLNYRMSDIQAALGLSQLQRIEANIVRRHEIAEQYNTAFSGYPIRLPYCAPDVRHAWHLYAIRVQQRDRVYARLRELGIGTQVHYKPVYLHSAYRRMGYQPGLCPVAEKAYSELLSIPMHHGLSSNDVSHVIASLKLTLEELNT